MKSLLTALLLAFTTIANAAYFNLADAPYNLTQADYSTKVADRYAAGKDTIAMPYAWAVLHGSEWGLTYSQFRSLYLFSAVFTDAAWHGEGKANTAKGYLNQFNFVEVPNGRYQSTISLTIPRAGFKGAGTFLYYGGDAWTTEIVMDDAGWIDTDKKWHERVLFSTPQWNDETNYSYNESYTVENIHLSGPGKNDGKIRIGIAFGRSGEASKWDMIKSDNWDYGIVAKQGVPMSGGTCSVFGNRIAGFAGIGCALASMHIDVISGDRNGSLLALLPGYGAASGGNLDVGLAKAEDANPQGGGKYGSQVVGWFEGQFHVTIANVRYSCDTRINDALFVVNPVIADHLDWGTQGSYVRATGQGFNYHTLLHNVSTSTRVAAGADYKSWSFEWFADGNRFVTNGPGDFAWKPAGTKALASLNRDPNTGAPIGVWNYTAGTPARTGGVAPPIPCTWTAGPWTAWSTCVNSQQSRTRTVTSTGVCTGVPAPPTVESQPCTMPPTGKRIIKGINCANGEQFTSAKGYQTAIDALHVGLMRWPGGTVANTYHLDNLDRMVAISVASKVDVIYVANLYDGTVEELLAALDAFTGAKVNVVGIELSNECYLKKWQDVFPTPQSYIDKCKTFIAALDASKYAAIPVGIVAAPSANMKDPDSKGTEPKRLADWNPVVLKAGIGDAIIIHAYTDEAGAGDFLGYALEHFDYCSTISGLPIWVTEYNLLGSEQSPAQIQFVGDMFAMMDHDTHVQFACLHNLAASGKNNNAIAITGGTRKPVAALTKLGQAFALE